MFRIIALGWTAALTVSLLAAELPAQEPTQDVPIDFESVIASARAGGGPRRGAPSQFRDFNEVTRGADKVEGLFTLYTFKTGDHLYGEIRPDQFNQPLLVPVTIARGLGRYCPHQCHGDRSAARRLR